MLLRRFGPLTLSYGTMQHIISLRCRQDIIGCLVAALPLPTSEDIDEQTGQRTNSRTANRILFRTEQRFSSCGWRTSGVGKESPRNPQARGNKLNRYNKSTTASFVAVLDPGTRRPISFLFAGCRYVSIFRILSSKIRILLLTS